MKVSDSNLTMMTHSPRLALIDGISQEIEQLLDDPEFAIKIAIIGSPSTGRIECYFLPVNLMTV